MAHPEPEQFAHHSDKSIGIPSPLFDNLSAAAATHVQPLQQMPQQAQRWTAQKYMNLAPLQIQQLQEVAVSSAHPPQQQGGRQVSLGHCACWWKLPMARRQELLQRSTLMTGLVAHLLMSLHSNRRVGLES